MINLKYIFSFVPKNYIKQNVNVVGGLTRFINVLKIYGNLYINNDVFNINNINK